MNLIKLIKDKVIIELLVTDDFDLLLITENVDRIFDYKQLFEKALHDFLSDYSSELDNYNSIVSGMKEAGVIGYPITPAMDARLYALDKNIVIKSELEINCDECK